MSAAPPLRASVPLVDDLFCQYEEVFGADREAYRNHVLRVFHFCRALAPGDAERDRKVAIAAFFHDLGIWTHRTLDYLAPSADLAASHLESIGCQAWQDEVRAMILEHHKVTRADAAEFPLVEAFRLADWTDVTLGLWHPGLQRRFVREVQRSYPDCGFHWRLVELVATRTRSHPRDPLPMFKW